MENKASKPGRRWCWGLALLWLGVAAAQAQLAPGTVVLSSNWEGMSGTFTTNFANWPSLPSFFLDDTVRYPAAPAPVPLIRVARFSSASGAALSPVTIPVANVGMNSMVWSVSTSATWITATAGPTVPAEGTGTLTVNVSSTGKAAGVYWGTATLTSGTNSARVGVRLEILSGP